MTRFFVQLPAGDTIALDLDLNTTTVAAVKGLVDARLEAFWRASGVRILRSDLPFCGITLSYCDRHLAMDKTLSSCKVKKEATIYAQWPEKSEKDERRKRYGKGWDNEPVLKKRMREEREEKRAEKKALREATKRTSCEVVEDTTSPTPEIDGDAQASSEFASDDGAGDRMEVEAQGDFSDAGGEDAQGLSQEVAEEQQDEQQAEEEEREERPTREVEQDDPFADEDSDKENREPQALGPVVENRANDHPPEEWLAFDESNSGLGLDLQEEVIEF